MRLFAALTISAWVGFTPLTAISGVDSSPIDELMEIVEEETSIDVSTSSNHGSIRSSANKTEQPTRVRPPERGSSSPGQSETSEGATKATAKFPEGTMTVGARGFAIEAGCVFMQVYRAATDSDFTATLELVQYRASSMGAEYLTVLFHQEGVNPRLAENFFDSVYLLQTRTVNPTIQTVMVVEMYDCNG